MKWKINIWRLHQKFYFPSRDKLKNSSRVVYLRSILSQMTIQTTFKFRWCTTPLEDLVDFSTYIALPNLHSNNKTFSPIFAASVHPRPSFWALRWNIPALALKSIWSKYGDLTPHCSLLALIAVVEFFNFNSGDFQVIDNTSGKLTRSP